MKLRVSIPMYFYYPEHADGDAIKAQIKPHMMSSNKFRDYLIDESLKAYKTLKEAEVYVNSVYRKWHYHFLEDWLKQGNELPGYVWNSLHKDDAEKLSRIHNRNGRRKLANYRRRINSAVRTSIYVRLKCRVKKVSIWRDLIDYTVDELMRHLEAQFKPGMAWDNYGEWHIDHIRPVASFNIRSYEDPAIKECWALSNLQPLWAKENMLKGAKYNAI